MLLGNTREVLLVAERRRHETMRQIVSKSTVVKQTLLSECLRASGVDFSQ
jgi:arginine repressor